jgi:hypothetical protein
MTNVEFREWLPAFLTKCRTAFVTSALNFVSDGGGL